MSKYFLLALSLVVGGVGTPSWSDITYTKDIAPLMHQKCAECHRPNQVAPMSLLTYGETRPWAKSIRQKVASREMPPWFEKGEMHQFKGDLRLTETEIETIVSWVDADCPKGKAADMPPIPEFAEGWQLGEPDMILELDMVSIAKGATDTLFNIEVPFSIDGDRYATAVEILPQPSTIVHHFILFMADDRENRSTGILNWLQGWAPGIRQYGFPEGSGRLIKEGARMTANIHLSPREEGGESIVKVGLHFADEDEELTESINHWTINNWFRIPAEDSNHFVQTEWTLPTDAMVYALAPHMHLRGKDMQFFAKHTDGREELLLDSVWSNEWQLFYRPVEPWRFKKGTKIVVKGHFDNSTGNEYNPDPTREVPWGLTVKDEMFIGYVDYIPIEDEESTDTSD